MPKRKRAYHGIKDGDAIQADQLTKRELEKKIVHGKKVLNRALRTARGFERQKLSKRIKQSVVDKDGGERDRLERELNVLKTLDLSIVGESHLYKTILKSKSIRELGQLPEYVKVVSKGNELLPEELTTISNVTARLYNSRPVKEALLQVIRIIQTILGIADPFATGINKGAGKITAELQSEHNNDAAPRVVNEDVDETRNVSGDEKPRMFVTNNGSETSMVPSNFHLDIESDSFDHSLSDALSKNEVKAEVDTNTWSKYPLSISGIPRQQDDTPDSFSQSSDSPSLLKNPKKPTKQAQQGVSKSGSTFLPTLMGGYWSGSESATDDVELSIRKKKNRPGQQARRALWEKRFGVRANHIKDQSLSKNREKDRNPRRGTRSAEHGHLKGGKTGGRGAESVPIRENADAKKPRVRGVGKKDDAGSLHPSWEAAKRAKEAKQTVPFQGKRIVFD